MPDTLLSNRSLLKQDLKSHRKSYDKNEFISVGNNNNKVPFIDMSKVVRNNISNTK